MNKMDLFFKDAANQALPDTKEIRDRILRDTAPENRRTKRWMPILAVACSLLLVLGSVPGVRAAVTSWFRSNGSVENHISAEAAARADTPEIDQYLQTAHGTLEVADIQPQWQAWAQELDLSVNDIYFDGQKIIAGCVLAPAPATNASHCPAGELYLGTNNLITLNERAYIVDGHTDYAGKQPQQSERFAVTVNMESLVALPPELEKLTDSNDLQSAIESLVASGQGEQAELTGRQKAEMLLPLVFVDYTNGTVQDDGIIHSGQQIGQLRLSFEFDADAGAATGSVIPLNQTISFVGNGTCTFIHEKNGQLHAENRNLDLSGIALTATALEISPSGADLLLALEPPTTLAAGDWNAIWGSLSYTLTANGEEIPVSSQTYSSLEEDESLSVRLHLDLLQSEAQALSSLEITPVLSHMTSCQLNDGTSLRLDQPICIPATMEQGWTEEYTALTENSLQVPLF